MSRGVRGVRFTKSPLGRGKVEVHGRRRLSCAKHISKALLTGGQLFPDLCTTRSLEETSLACSTTLVTCSGWAREKERL